MLTLALETSTSRGGVAITRDGKVLARKSWSREGSHGEALTPAIEDCLKDAGINAADLDAVALGRGPGSFTGVRIAVNAARSLAYSLKKPVYAFTTNEILAAGVSRTDLPLLTLVNAHKNMLFASRFTWDAQKAIWQQEREVEALTLEELEALVQGPHLRLGDGFEEYENHFAPGLKPLLVRDPDISDDPLAEVLAKLAWERRSTVQPLDWKEVQALYIRASGAEEKLRESREK